MFILICLLEQRIVVQVDKSYISTYSIKVILSENLLRKGYNNCKIIFLKCEKTD